MKMQLTIDDGLLEQSVKKVMLQHNFFQTKRGNRWFNKTNAAKYLNVSIPTFNLWLKKYQIPFSTIDGIHRFSGKDLDQFMENHKNEK